MNNIILAIDGGATKTDCWIFDTSGNLLGKGRGGPSNHLLERLEVVKHSIRQGINQALKNARLRPEEIGLVSAGMAGVGPKGEHQGPIIKILKQILNRSKAVAIGDQVTALRGALAGEPGIILIAGTGSVIFGENHKGDSQRVGGWGPIFGDEGSGYGIARAGLFAAARGDDGRGPRTSLSRLIPKALGVKNVYGLIQKIYVEQMPRDELAGLSQVVVRAALNGDKVARKIFQEAAQELALGAKAIIKKLRLTKGTKISYVGSVFKAGPLIITPLRKYLKIMVPNARLITPIFPPIIGSYLEGLKYLDREINSFLLARLRRLC
jgi:N-acetylglucosamine kinase-like BadF-type ATPase